MIEENVIYKARLHWVIFLGPFIMLFLTSVLAIKYEQGHTAAFIMSIVALLWGAMVWTTYHFSFLLIKPNQVILCTGVLMRQTIDIPLSKIESIDIRQSIFGSLLHYGTLVITGTGGTRQWVNYLNRPLTCRRHIEQLMHG